MADLGWGAFYKILCTASGQGVISHPVYKVITHFCTFVARIDHSKS